MIIAIWGRDGIGKSTLCNALGMLFAKKQITAVIDTDLTQPTLPIRLSGKQFDTNSSIGKAISGIGTGDVSRYLHQHPIQKALFYAGLTDADTYMTYEIGLEADDTAQDVIEQCAELVDTVILDNSGQRTDPFLPSALIHSHILINLFSPDVQGVCWYHSVVPLLNSIMQRDAYFRLPQWLAGFMTWPQSKRQPAYGLTRRSRM